MEESKQEVKCRRVGEDYENFSYPVKTHEDDSGADLFIYKEAKREGCVVYYHTGLAFEPPPNKHILIYPRSSLSKTDWWLANSVGVVDNTYRGEVLLAFRTYPAPFEPRPLTLPGRYVQMFVEDIPQSAKFVPVDSLAETIRGSGGFGSTGTGIKK